MQLIQDKSLHVQHKNSNFLQPQCLCISIMFIYHILAAMEAEVYFIAH